MRRMFAFVMLALKSLADKHCREHGKDECLQEGYQHFNKINEDGKRNRYNGTAPSGGRMHL